MENIYLAVWVILVVTLVCGLVWASIKLGSVLGTRETLEEVERQANEDIKDMVERAEEVRDPNSDIDTDKFL